MRLRGQIILALPPEEVPTTVPDFIKTCYLRGESCAGLHMSANSLSFLRAILHGEVEEILRQEDYELLQSTPAVDLALHSQDPRVQAAVLSKIQFWDDVAISGLETIPWTPGLKSFLRELPPHGYLCGFLKTDPADCCGQAQLLGYIRGQPDPFAVRPEIWKRIRQIYIHSSEDLDLTCVRLGYFAGIGHDSPDPAIMQIALAKGYPELLSRQLEFLSEPTAPLRFDIYLEEFTLQVRKRYKEVLASVRSQPLLQLAEQSLWQLMLVCGERVEVSAEQLLLPGVDFNLTVGEILMRLAVQICHPQIELLPTPLPIWLEDINICPGDGLYDVVAHFRHHSQGSRHELDLLSRLVIRNQLWEVRDCPQLQSWLGRVTYGVQHQKYQEILAQLQ